MWFRVNISLFSGVREYHNLRMNRHFFGAWVFNEFDTHTHWHWWGLEHEHDPLGYCAGRGVDLGWWRFRGFQYFPIGSWTELLLKTSFIPWICSVSWLQYVFDVFGLLYMLQYCKYCFPAPKPSFPTGCWTCIYAMSLCGLCVGEIFEGDFRQMFRRNSSWPMFIVPETAVSCSCHRRCSWYSAIDAWFRQSLEFVGLKTASGFGCRQQSHLTFQRNMGHMDFGDLHIRSFKPMRFHIFFGLDFLANAILAF